MTINIQALRERRNTRAKALHELLEKNPAEKWNAEHQATYDQGMAEITDLDNEIGRHQALMDRMENEAIDESIADAAGRNHNGKRSDASVLYAKWLRGGDKAMSAEDWASIRNTMSTGAGSEGGYTVQTDVAKSIADALKKFGGMRAVAEVFQTDQGNSMEFPTSNGTSETGELIAENATATDADPTFGTVALNVYKFSSKVVAVPFELLMDSAIDIEMFVNNRLTQRIGRITNTYFTTGTGSGQPRGIVTAAASGKVGTTGQTTTVIYDDLVDLIHSVDPAYREEGGCRFMMADSSLKVVRKLKDSAGRPIFLPGYEGLSGPMADALLGHEIAINQDMAAMAANAKSILFGDFSHYKVRDVLQASLFRFTDSAYTKKGQVGFLMWARSGGNFTDVGGAVKYYQNSAT